jgi:hypothetical protein
MHNRLQKPFDYIKYRPKLQLAQKGIVELQDATEQQR